MQHSTPLSWDNVFTELFAMDFGIVISVKQDLEKMF